MSSKRPFTLLCFKCGKRAASFLETRINGGRVKKFTFFHANGDTCTVEIERSIPSEMASDQSARRSYPTMTIKNDLQIA